MLTQETVTAIEKQLLNAEPMIYAISELWELDNLTGALISRTDLFTVEWKINYLLLCLEANDAEA